jgi:translation elongation factor EF-Tu-like GTPase
MGFWARLFGREVDTTVTDYQSQVASAPGPEPVPTILTGGSIGGTFRFTVEDVFVITGRGTVVTGRVEVGTVSVGDVLEWVHPDGTARSTTVSAIEAFRKKLDTAGVGEMIGLLLRDVERADIPAGTVLSRP